MTKTYTTRSNALRAARKAGLPDDAAQPNTDGSYTVAFSMVEAFTTDGIDPPAQDDVPVVEVEPAVAQVEPAAVAEQPAPAPVAAPGVRPELGQTGIMWLALAVPAADAVGLAVMIANKTGFYVDVTNPATQRLLQTVHPATKGQKAPKADKPAREPKVRAEKQPRAPRAPKTEPSGMAAKIVQMCSRPEGATPTDLNELTNWSKAPWRWLLSNRKGTGFAERFGYSFEASKDQATRGVIYKLTKVRPQAGQTGVSSPEMAA